MGALMGSSKGSTGPGAQGRRFGWTPQALPSASQALPSASQALPRTPPALPGPPKPPGDNGDVVTGPVSYTTLTLPTNLRV